MIFLSVSNRVCYFFKQYKTKLLTVKLSPRTKFPSKFHYPKLLNHKGQKKERKEVTEALRNTVSSKQILQTVTKLSIKLQKK